jgi:hypothetical protein
LERILMRAKLVDRMKKANQPGSEASNPRRAARFSDDVYVD